MLQTGPPLRDHHTLANGNRGWPTLVTPPWDTTLCGQNFGHEFLSQYLNAEVCYALAPMNSRIDRKLKELLLNSLKDRSKPQRTFIEQLKFVQVVRKIVKLTFVIGWKIYTQREREREREKESKEAWENSKMVVIHSAFLELNQPSYRGEPRLQLIVSRKVDSFCRPLCTER